MTWPVSTQPVLFIDTPRAGNLGHRFLTAINCPFSEPQLAEIADAARSGNNIQMPMLVRKVPIRVTTASGVVRDAEEILILYGVDAHRLSKNLLGDFNAMLDKFVAGLDDLIKGMDWRNAQLQLVVDSAIVNGWQKRIRSLDLPVALSNTLEKTGSDPICENLMIADQRVAVCKNTIMKKIMLFGFAPIFFIVPSFFSGIYFGKTCWPRGFDDISCKVVVEKNNCEDDVNAKVNDEQSVIPIHENKTVKNISLFKSKDIRIELDVYEKMMPGDLRRKSVEFSKMLMRAINENDSISDDDKNRIRGFSKNIDKDFDDKDELAIFEKKSFLDKINYLVESIKNSALHKDMLRDLVLDRLKNIEVKIIVNEKKVSVNEKNVFDNILVSKGIFIDIVGGGNSLPYIEPKTGRTISVQLSTKALE
jgi:hypothetical protein